MDATVLTNEVLALQSVLDRDYPDGVVKNVFIVCDVEQVTDDPDDETGAAFVTGSNIERMWIRRALARAGLESLDDPEELSEPDDPG